MTTIQKLKLIGHLAAEQPLFVGVGGRTDIPTWDADAATTGWAESGLFIKPHARAGYNFSFGSHTGVRAITLNDIVSQTGRIGAVTSKGGPSAPAGPFSVFSLRYYTLMPGYPGIIDQPNYVSTVNFMSGTTQLDPLVCWENRVTQFANQGKMLVPGRTGWTSTTRVNQWVRVEAQFNNSFTPKMVVRLYAQDGTTPFQTWSYDPGFTSIDSVGLTAGDNGSTSAGIPPQVRVALLEVCDTYDLDGEFPGGTATVATTSNPSGTGTPETEQTLYSYPTDQMDRSSTITEDFPSTPEYYAYRFSPDMTAGIWIPDGYPPTTDGFPVVVWAHSGFFVTGSFSDIPANWRTTLLNAGYAVLSVDYTKSTVAIGSYEAFGNTADQAAFQDFEPGFGQYPSWIVDVKLAAARLADEAVANGWNIDTTRMFSTGYSAGGYIGLAAAISEGVTDDGSGRDLTIEGNPTYADGYTGPDPHFLGAFCYAPPVDLQVAATFDMSDPGLGPGLYTLAGVTDRGAVNVAARAFMGQIATTVTDPDLTDTDIPNMIAKRALIGDVPPVACVWGSGDFLVHKWGHDPLMAAAMSAAGASYTSLDAETIHDWINAEFKANDILNFLNDLVDASGGVHGPPTATPNGNIRITAVGNTVGTDLQAVGDDPPIDDEAAGVASSRAGIGVPTITTTGRRNGSAFPQAVRVTQVAPSTMINGLDSLPVPGTPPAFILRGTTWDIYLADQRSDRYGQRLTKARQKTFRFSLTEQSSASFSIGGLEPEAMQVDELVDDIVGVRNGRPLFRGRVVGSNDEIEETIHEVSFTASDYKGLLFRRTIDKEIDTLDAAQEQVNIAWKFINDAQLAVGGDMGITRGLSAPTGISRGDLWLVGTSIGEALDDLGGRDFGFEWSIDEALRFNIHYPVRGRVRGFVARYGGNVRKVSRTLDPSSYANAVTSTGQDQFGFPLQARTALDDLGVAPQGRWDVLDSSAASTSTELLRRAQGVLAASSALTPTYTLELMDGIWEPDDCWVGDTIRVIIKKGRLDVNALYRIQTIDITASENSTESVKLTVGQPEMSLSARLWFYSRRITELERR